MRRLATIGVYGFTAATFVQKLTDDGVGLVLDLRQLPVPRGRPPGRGQAQPHHAGARYAERYTREVLDPFDLGTLVSELPSDGATALCCVERDPEAARDSHDHGHHR